FSVGLAACADPRLLNEATTGAASAPCATLFRKSLRSTTTFSNLCSLDLLDQSLKQLRRKLHQKVSPHNPRVRTRHGVERVLDLVLVEECRETLCCREKTVVCSAADPQQMQ